MQMQSPASSTYLGELSQAAAQASQPRSFSAKGWRVQ